MSDRWLWTQKEDIGPRPRWGAALAYEGARQRVVLFGGTETNLGAGFNDTWEWDGGAWTQVADMGPSGRWYSAMAYDDSRQQLVLFGGGVRGTQGYQTNGDTWEWNSTEWTQVADIGPGPRMSCALTYDTVRQRTVLFGGYNQPNMYFDDTWEWDGTEWTQIADTGPPQRMYPAMVFDRSRECLVLFGGWAPGPGGLGWLGDTWEWGEDTGWVKRQDIGPQSLAYPKMVYTGEHTVLFGYPPGSRAGHTWEWDGRLWTQRQDMGPPAREAHALAYDSQRDRVVLFGGLASPIPLGDTWELAIIEQ